MTSTKAMKWTEKAAFRFRKETEWEAYSAIRTLLAAGLLYEPEPGYYRLTPSGVKEVFGEQAETIDLKKT